MILKTFPSPRGVVIVPVHYTHDDAKASPEWRENEIKKYARIEDFQREMELDFGLHLGAPAYPHFKRAVHVYDELPYFDRLPLVLFCDFNQSPMAWGIGQTVGGATCVIDEIFREPSTIEGAVEEFRNAYPAHKGELWIYGDATTRSFYDTIRLALRGYSATISMRVPMANPKVKERVNAVNVRLKGVDGAPGIKIARKCINLIQDLEEVMWRPNEKDLLKVTDPTDPYYKRTHASDGLGYWIARDWPVRDADIKPAKRAPLKPGRVLGDLYYKERDGKARGAA